jgi:tricorn protease
MPYMFKQMAIGPLVGTKTWGGLVGIWDAPPLVDGGSITAPRGGFFNLQDQWDVENKGVAPDIEVEMTPKDVIAGHDPQLEAAVNAALKLLQQHPFVRLAEPPPPAPARRPAPAAASASGSGSNQ